VDGYTVHGISRLRSAYIGVWDLLDIPHIWQDVFGGLEKTYLGRYKVRTYVLLGTEIKKNTG